MNNESNIYDVFYYNGIKYSELKNEKHKLVIDKMVIELERQDLADTILGQYDPAFDIIQPSDKGVSFEIQSTLAQDITDKITHIYSTVKDS